MADGRPFIKVHNGMPEHHKIAGLSDKAFRTLVELWCYCSRTLSDGAVPDGIVRRYATPKVIRELVDAGLVDKTAAGVVMHDYLDHQQSKDEVEALAEKRRAAGAKGGRAKAERVASGLASATANAKQTSSPGVPDTDTESEPNGSDVSPRPDVEALCTHLADRIEANGSPRPRVTKAWRDAARLMLDRDDRSPEQVHRAIDWCQGHDFWRANVMSMPKLREKYDQLRLQAVRAESRPVDRQAEVLRREMADALEYEAAQGPQRLELGA